MLIKKDMIIASHESIHGHYEKVMNMFKNNSLVLSKEAQKEFIEMYCSDELKNIIETYI